LTTIVAVKDETGGVTFGWDSQSTSGHHKKLSVSEKVFRNGSVVLGVSGAVRASNLIEFMDVPEVDSYRPGFDSRAWAITGFIPELRRTLKNGGVVDSDAYEYWNGSAVLAVEGEIYRIGPDFAVMKAEDGIIAIGSGGDLAEAALRNGASVEEAVRQATQRDVYSGGEIHVKTVEGFFSDE